MLWQFLASRMVGAGLPGAGQRAFFFQCRTGGFLFDFLNRDAGFVQEQQSLVGRKLLALGPPQAQVKPADFFSLKLDDAPLRLQRLLQTRDLGLSFLQGLLESG